MCGCSSRALVRASRTNRSASPGEGVSPRSSTFTATSWPCSWSRTRNTAANPPSPRTSPTVNFLPRAFWRRRRSVVRSSDMADAKPRNLRRVALGTAGVVLVWLLAVWPPPVWWRDHWPRETAMMRGMADCRTGGRPDRSLPSACPTVRPSALKDISPVLQPYLNVAEWGPGSWGVDAASRAYFAVPASRLTEEQGAELAATLSHPRTSNPTFRPERTLARRNLILARYRGVNVYIPPEEETDSLPIPLPAPVVPPALDSLRIDVPVDSLEDSLTGRRTDAQRRTEDSVRDSLP